MGGIAPVPPEVIERMVEMRREGASFGAIATKFGIHENTARKHVNAVLNEERTPTKTEMARQMFSDGATIMQVVHRLDIPAHTAKQIRQTVFGPYRPSDEQLSMTVWRMFSHGWEPSEIDRNLGISNAREIIVYEWRMDREKKPSLVGSKL